MYKSNSWKNSFKIISFRIYRYASHCVEIMETQCDIFRNLLSHDFCANFEKYFVKSLT